MTPSPDQIQAIQNLGVLGLVVIGFIALYTGRVLSRGAANELLAEKDKQIAYVTEDRDEWKQIAKDSVEHVDRLSDIIETQQGKFPK